MVKKLAILGHSTRGKEVIELLEMMGGSNIHNLSGNDIYSYYIIKGFKNEIRNELYIFGNEDIYYFILEEFLEKYPFKVGDKVQVLKSGKVFTIGNMVWDDEDCDIYYYNMTDIEYYNVEELKLYKETDTVKSVTDKNERTHEDVIFDSIIWHLRNSVNNGKQNLSGGECEDYFRELVKKNNENKMKNVLAELLEHIKNTSKKELEKEFNELEEWSHIGPTVEEFITFCECVNKKPTYPKTYVECCEVIANSKPYAMNEHYTDVNKLLQTLQTILICRDAYWKIAGEEMGLGKPWEPDWSSFSEGSYPTITKCIGKIVKTSIYTHDCPLAFPTAEMRDAFYENFKDLIEQCKELL